MPDQESPLKRHFHLEGEGRTEPFEYAGPRGGTNGVPLRNRRHHGQGLMGQVRGLVPRFEEAKRAQAAAGMDDGFGLQVEFESFPDIELAFESLAPERSGIELLNVRRDGDRNLATVFIPDGKLRIFENKIVAYLDESRDSKKSGPKNASLLNTISEIRAATINALWTDDRDAFPVTDDEELWWEVWLPTRGDRTAVIQQFRQMVDGLGFRIAPGELKFPERTVLLVFGTSGRMKQSMLTLNSIAELRRAKETASFFDELAPDQQSEWLEDLLGRLTVPDEGSNAPHVCILDTGVNRGHPLIATVLSEADLHTVEPGWDVDDRDGHGTAMAGLAMAGDLTGPLESDDPIEITHRLESVKILRNDGDGGNDAVHHGYVTQEAIARTEVTAPDRRRVIGMAVTARDNRDRGKPSAWSAALDRIASDAETQGETRRLFIVSSGNVSDPCAWRQYPGSNSTDGIHDPGQSWNALTVGAYTDLVNITDEDAENYVPIAPAGGLSPFSTTSQTWQAHWPIKPDVVFEGGNAAQDAINSSPMPSLSLLTTDRAPAERLFTTINATSAATGLASRMAAQLMAEYPALWPESIRGLIVHSAEWTEAMKQQFLPSDGAPNKADYLALARHCGFGVPNLERAMWSVDNSLTMVCEDTMHPYQEGSSAPKLRDMNLHALPWPLEKLQAFGDAQIEMRVTLSYFIEPNPSDRGVKSRYRYESHGLRFKVKRPHESVEDFRARINAAARQEDDDRGHGTGNDPQWIIGPQNRHKGSLHADIWQGSAADLASRGAIAVYPTSGWWKTRPKLAMYNQSVRYSLIVSIHAPELDVDLYSAVFNKIKAQIEVET